MCFLQDYYEGVEDDEHFLSTEERQNIVYQILLNVRAVQGESLGAVKFLEGQPIGKYWKIWLTVHPWNYRFRGTTHR